MWSSLHGWDASPVIREGVFCRNSSEGVSMGQDADVTRGVHHAQHDHRAPEIASLKRPELIVEPDFFC